MEKKLIVDQVGKSVLPALGGNESSWRQRLAGLRQALLLQQSDSLASRRKAGLALALTIALTGVFYLATLKPGQDWGDDFAQYLVHAKNLATGRAYKESSYINNTDAMIGPEVYPPVWPAMLVPVYRWFHGSMLVMKVEQVFIFLLTLLVMFWLFKRDLPWPLLISLLALISLNPWIWQFRDRLISEMAFLLFIYLSFYLVERGYERNRKGWGRVADAVLIGLAIYLAYGTRSVGLVLIPAFGAYDLLKNRRPTWLAVQAISLALGLVFWQNRTLNSVGGYGPQLEPSLSYVKQSMTEMIQLLSSYWSNGFFKPGQWALFAVLSGLAVLGLVIKLKRHLSITELFPVFYLLPFLILPLAMSVRYVVPLVPIFLLYAFIGLAEIVRRFQFGGVCYAGLVLALLLSYAGTYYKSHDSLTPPSLGTRDTQELFEFVDQQVTDNDVIVFRKPRAFALLTGKKVTVWHQEPDDQKLWDFFHRVKATYLIIGPKNIEPEDQAFISAFVERNRDRFAETFTNADYTMYRIN